MVRNYPIVDPSTGCMCGFIYLLTGLFVFIFVLAVAFHGVLNIISTCIYST